MKKYVALLLVVLMCFSLVSCGANDAAPAVSGDDAAAQPGASALSGETMWLPSSVTYIGADGTRYEMQTIAMEGTVAKVRLYGYNKYADKVLLSSGYDADLSKVSPFELSLVRPPEADGTTDYGVRRFTVSQDGASIKKESAYRLSEGINNTIDYAITYDAQDRIEKVVIKDKYGDNPETIEERLYQYGDTGYTISYTDSGWSATDDDGTRVLRHFVYEIPYEGDDITITETYRKEDGTEHCPDDFHTYSKQKVAKLVYKVNRQGFCTGNTLYMKNGQTTSDRDFSGNLSFSVEFNDKGMPTKYVTTSVDGSHPHTSTYTYDENGNLTKYHEEGGNVNFTCELKWEKFPAELVQSFGAIFNFSHFAIREVIEDNCPQILLGPQELIYKKSDIVG